MEVAAVVLAKALLASIGWCHYKSVIASFVRAGCSGRIVMAKFWSSVVCCGRQDPHAWEARICLAYFMLALLPLAH
jgi:hypothetical protein